MIGHLPVSGGSQAACSDARDILRGMPAAALAPLIDELRAVLGDRTSTSDAVREHHSHGESWITPAAPDAVVFPISTAEVAATVSACARHRVPMVPFGMGSSLEGHVHAIRGGISIDLTRMTKVVRLSPDDMDVTVEAGLTHRQLNERLKNTGLMFPVDPGADATLGGMAATRASGTTSVRYGTMRDQVMGLMVVLADGRVIHTGGRARKSSSGYDLTRLFVGSEGTLGVITELTLRLHGRPEAVLTAVCPFGSMQGAAATVIQTIQLGIPVARIEIVDEAQLRLLNQHSKTSYAEAPTLFFEFHGLGRAAVDEQARAVEEIAAEHGAQGFRWAASPEDRAKLWEARHNALYATIASRPGARPWTTDVCVPISRLAECIVETQGDLAASGVVAPLVGHAGDGNFHLIFMLSPGDDAELEKVKALNGRLVERALGFGGTCTGEHGIGLGKLAYVEREHGEAVAVMRDIKRALDPGNLMNPGKLVPGME
jgi:D-lactate dehydrogenase (cytochrome)